MSETGAAVPRGSWLDRALRPLADVRPGEGSTALLMLANLFLLMVGYSVLKVAREALILREGAASLAAYATAVQAVVLMVFIPLYGRYARRVKRLPLVIGTIAFFLVCIEMFYAAVQAGVPYVGFTFFVWIGIFNLATVAQFWSYANDVYARPEGERLFPLIMIGATAGAPVGTRVAAELFRAEVPTTTIFQVSAALVLLHLVLYAVVHRRTANRRAAAEPPPLTGPGGFTLVARSPYLRLAAVLFILLNVVNTSGEQMIRHLVKQASLTVANPEAFVGAYYGAYQFWVNVIALLLQAFVVSRLVKWFGLAGVVLTLPLVALGAYGLIALGVPFAIIRWAKTAENATDYSVMNTGRHMLWLPTTRDEKYKGKQTIDTFFVRTGDVLAAGAYVAATQWLGLAVRGLAVFNIVLSAVWLYVAWRVLRENARITGAREEVRAAS